MYGALTGLSKKMIRQRHGAEKFMKWRRGFDDRPPPISSFSSYYPGNDDRYVSNVNDVRYSVFETLIRSISHRRFELHRKFPKAESLKDCMERTIPYFKNKILPSSIESGKNVLIASSENAIRGLLMYLCEIPPERIHEVEIPTGLPLIFDVKKKCIQLLQDEESYRLEQELGSSFDPIARYDFGTSPELLFRPCDFRNTSNDSSSSLNEDTDECFISDSGRTYAYDPLIRLPVNKTTTMFNQYDFDDLPIDYRNNSEFDGFRQSRQAEVDVFLDLST